MYRDNTLAPTEAIRLAALGTLATAQRSYADLAAEVRHFVSHMVGPSLELIGPPLEILKLEGLIADTAAGAGHERLLAITPAGHDELRRLLRANVRAPLNDVSKLIIALKVRFLHLLDERDRFLQTQVLIEMLETERARLAALRRDAGGDDSLFAGWLDLEIAQTEARLSWFEQLAARAGGSSGEPAAPAPQ
jgi:DNA-binding PadR family transcriptional regulator